jgi:hypothetical protein
LDGSNTANESKCSIVTYFYINPMDAIEFVSNYDKYLEEIRSVICPELFPQLDELAQIDPHDLVTPETWFQNENDARGLV